MVHIIIVFFMKFPVSLRVLYSKLLSESIITASTSSNNDTDTKKHD
ncbi:MAG: hypothetical protein ACJA1U_000378 [Bermanella sp.]|jgi:hypothetical protein